MPVEAWKRIKRLNMAKERTKGEERGMAERTWWVGGETGGRGPPEDQAALPSLAGFLWELQKEAELLER